MNICKKNRHGLHTCQISEGCLYFGVLWHHIAKDVWSQFLTINFCAFCASYRRNLIAYLDFWEDYEPEAYALKQKHWHKNLALFDPTLTWPSPQVKLDHVITSMNIILDAIWARKHVSHGMYTTFVFQWHLVSLPDHHPIKYDIRTYAMSFLDTYRNLGWVSDI